MMSVIQTVSFGKSLYFVVYVFVLRTLLDISIILHLLRSYFA